MKMAKKSMLMLVLWQVKQREKIAELELIKFSKWTCQTETTGDGFVYANIQNMHDNLSGHYFYIDCITQSPWTEEVMPRCLEVFQLMWFPIVQI